MMRESWLPAAPESALIARSLVREAAAEHGLGGEATWDLTLATTEAVANAVLHGGACEENGGILLRIGPCEEGLCVEVCDCGEFDAELRQPRPEDENDRSGSGQAQHLAQGGRGIPIIAAVVDHFELLPSDRFTRVRFTKRRAAA
jgi:anti-sigma regulatory factor (Ser/Thr protein kinase)